MTNFILNTLSNYFEHLTVALFASVSFYYVYKKRRRESFAIKTLAETVSMGIEPISLHPVVDPNLCAGCGICTRVCPEGDILRMIDGHPKLVNPTKCVGHGECQSSCPFGAIDLAFGTKTRGVELPNVTTDYETNVPGLYISGELGGMGLIRNAIKQGNLACTHAIKNLKKASGFDTDILVIGAGPAGLSCNLTAIAKGQKYICIEQNSLGGTVYNFPRQKVVMSHPADIPGFGQMKLPGNQASKEKLLAYWKFLKKKSGMKIRTGVKFDTLEKIDGGGFKVITDKGEIKAQKVILCMGVRGSPRKLGLENEDSPKVAYNLIDPAQYVQKHVAVVGGGNAGVEAAQMLASKEYRNTVHLLVRGEFMDRCNDTNKKIINKMQDEGLVKIWYNSSVNAIQKEHIVVTKEGKDIEIPNDFLFIFAGAIMPFKFLMSLGVKIDKSFGDRKIKSS